MIVYERYFPLSCPNSQLHRDRWLDFLATLFPKVICTIIMLLGSAISLYFPLVVSKVLIQESWSLVLHRSEVREGPWIAMQQVGLSVCALFPHAAGIPAKWLATGIMALAWLWARPPVDQKEQLSDCLVARNKAQGYGNWNKPSWGTGRVPVPQLGSMILISNYTLPAAAGGERVRACHGCMQTH